MCIVLQASPLNGTVFRVSFDCSIADQPMARACGRVVYDCTESKLKNICAHATWIRGVEKRRTPTAVEPVPIWNVDADELIAY